MEARARDAGELDGGRVLAGIGGILLLVGLFLDWFSVPGHGEGFSAFTVFEIVDLILAAAAVAAIVLALEPFAGGAVALPAPGRLLNVVAPVAFLLVAVSVANEPPAAQGADLEAGAWLSLAGAAIMLAGAFLSGNRISLVVAPREPRTPPDATETRQL